MSAGWRVPGRLEVLGKHTDYAGGAVLVCAVDAAVTARAVPDPAGPGIRVRSDAAREELTIVPGRAVRWPSGHWGRYVQTVADRLARNFGPLAPCRLRITSTLPLASGMSSSSALVVATALTLADLNGFPQTARWRHAGPDRLRLAGYLASIENGRSWGPLAGNAGVGTRGGSEDHAAMLCGTADALTSFEFDPVRVVTTVPVPPDLTFVVAVSGVLAEKSGAARGSYNAAAAAAAEVLARWNAATGRADGSLAAALRADADRQLPGLVADAPALAARLDHFVAESTRLVPGAVAALAAGDLDTLGAVCDESQRLAEALLSNQVPATSALARSARALGARAASAFGAGFGGSVWALVPTNEAPGFARAWLERHRRDVPGGVAATTVLTRPGPPAARVSRGAAAATGGGGEGRAGQQEAAGRMGGDADTGEKGQATCAYS